MTENGRMTCFYCQAETHSLCDNCKRAFCSDHGSIFDTKVCTECINSVNTNINSEPLIDEEGVEHKGRRIRLVGETWFRNKDVIAKMTDQELRGKLISLEQAVKEAEKILDYRKIMHSWVDNEIEERGSRKAARLRLIKNVGTTHANLNKHGEIKTEQNKNLAEAMRALGSMGLSKDKILELIAKLAQGKK